MTGVQSRESLHGFLAGARSRTGDALEPAALAEMAGYTALDARAEGWPDIFQLSASVPLRTDESADRDAEDLERTSAWAAFLRGLTYVAPVVAIWSLFPSPIAAGEVTFLALAVGLSWGGSMASSTVVGAWLPCDAARAWRIALRTAVLATGIAAAAGLVLASRGSIGMQAAVVGILQVVYFFSASPMMLSRRRALLGVIACTGAIAGAISLLDPAWADQQWLAGLTGQQLLHEVAAGCLVLPAFVLVGQVVDTRGAERGPAAVVDSRDVLAFGAYGISFALLILWGPVVLPGSALTMLTLVIVAGIPFAEVAVTLVRRQADALLDRGYDGDSFARRARTLVLTGCAAYVVPVGLGVLVAVSLVGGSEPVSVRVMAVLAVVGLGTAQMLSLIGMSVHAIRSCAAAITTCAASLLIATILLDGTRDLLTAYLTSLAVLCVWLLVIVMRVSAHPFNLL